MWLRKRKPCKRGYEFKLLDQSQDAANGGDDDPLGMAAHAVLSSFKDSTTGSLLVQSHTEIREANAAADESPGSLLLDLLVLLALSERADFAMPQTRLCIHGWRPTSSPLTDYKPITYHLQYTTIWTASVSALLKDGAVPIALEYIRVAGTGAWHFGFGFGRWPGITYSSFHIGSTPSIQSETGRRVDSQSFAS